MSTLIKVKKLYEDAKIPTRATAGSSGWDVYAYMKLYHRHDIMPGERFKVSVGVAVEIPFGYEIQFRGRSGLAFKRGIVGYNGTIDSDYRGEIFGLLFNQSYMNYTVNHGDKIGQLVVQKIPEVDFIEVAELSETDRGVKGFGSSGR